MLKNKEGLVSKKFVAGLLFAVIIAAGTFVIGAAGVNAQQSPLVPSWPHEQSDLLPDPSVLYGRLPNGFRYVLMENHNPRDRVSLHLNIQAGSMHETSDQQGLAHFLEHMMFNGSTHFPPGELVKYFQSIGMQFGPDANAHTGFGETVYDILLPDGSRESLEKGLLVLQDYAMGALLLPEEIDRERRVILAEKRSRDSAGYRTFVSTLKFEFPDARLSRRLPIGREEVIRQADRSLLTDFYDTWYRPETMILVMVGDFDAAEAAVLINDRFKTFTPRAPSRPEPDFGRIQHEGVKAFYHYEKETGKTTVTIEVIEKKDPEPDSLALQKRTLIRIIADRIVQNRLNALLRKPDTPFTSASIGSGFFLRQARIGTINAECKPENWQKALGLIELTPRQALDCGFTESELERVKKDFLSELDNAVKQAPTRESPELARDIISHLNADRVFMSPAQEKQIFAPLINALTPQIIHDGFKKTWSPSHRLILLTGNIDLTGGTRRPEDVIIAAYSESLRLSVSPPVALKSAVFPYLPDPAIAGKIVHQRAVSDIGVVQIDFENGVRLNIKPTDFKADEVSAILNFGFGKSSQPVDKAGLADLSADVINESGFGALSRDELDRALAGRSTDVVFGITEDRFFLKGTTISEEIPLLFQLFYTFLQDPGFREEAFELSMARFKQQYLELSRSTDGAMVLHGRRFLAGGDSRFGLPSFEAFSQLTLDDVRSWVGPLLANAVFEVSVVGDFDVQTVIDLAGRYFGSLPGRHAPGPPLRETGPAFPVSRSLIHRVHTEIPKGLVVVAYPTEDMWNIHRTRRLNVLGEVFSDRLRERIREKLGAAYSPFAFNRPSRAYRGYGVFQAFIQTAPDEADIVRREVMAMAAELARTGVRPEELKRALEPTITSIKDMLRTNGYWLNTVLSGSRRHPEQLDWNRSIVGDYAAISAHELSVLAEKYLDNRKAATIVVLPE